MDSFDKIYSRYSRALMKFAMGMVKDRARAEDVVHNIFIRLLSCGIEFESEASLRNWLYVCARNEVISTLRSCWERKVVRVDNYPETAEQVSDDCGGGYDISYLQNALGSMPEKRAEVFRLSKMERLPNDEIARKMGISVRTVEKHLQLAFKDIRHKVS